MKRFFKKILKVMFCLLIIGGVIFFTYNYTQYKNNKDDAVKREVKALEDSKLQQELLEKEVAKSQNFIEELNNNVALTLLRTSGKITLSHDKTPENNGWTEWLFNSDIKVYATYNTTFSIETSSINSTIADDATIIISYDEDDIKLSSIDITDFSTSNNKSIFGSSYKPSEVAAFEQIARDSILEKTSSEDNLKQASSNLKNYISTLAQKLNVNVKVVEK